MVNLLLDGRVSSCGCLSSKGEEKVASLLDDLNIYYVRQKIFDDCINPTTNAKLRFDFFLPERNILIEVDGAQHHKDYSGWFKRSKFEEIVKRDNIKNNYCYKNKIPLIRIPYYELDIVDEDYMREAIYGVL